MQAVSGSGVQFGSFGKQSLGKSRLLELNHPCRMEGKTPKKTPRVTGYPFESTLSMRKLHKTRQRRCQECCELNSSQSEEMIVLQPAQVEGPWLFLRRAKKNHVSTEVGFFLP